MSRPVDGVDHRAFELLELVADGVVVVDRHGVIAYVTRRAAELLGYGPGELIGQAVEVLVPEAARTVHERVRADYVRSPHHREMGTGLPLEARRRDGVLVPVDIRLAPMPGGRYVVASVRPLAEVADGATPHPHHSRQVLDTVVQHLFAVGMSLAALGTTAPAGFSEQLATSADLIDRTLELTRRAAADDPDR